jgi:hypothetical protein
LEESSLLPPRKEHDRQAAHPRFLGQGRVALQAQHLMPVSKRRQVASYPKLSAHQSHHLCPQAHRYPDPAGDAAGKLPAQQVREIREAFQVLDRDNDGLVDKASLISLTCCAGSFPAASPAGPVKPLFLVPRIGDHIHLWCPPASSINHIQWRMASRVLRRASGPFRSRTLEESSLLPPRKEHDRQAAHPRFLGQGRVTSSLSTSPSLSRSRTWKASLISLTCCAGSFPALSPF